MIRAFLLWLLKPIYEVRRINLTSGRRINGTLVYSGDSYQDALSAYHKHYLKEGTRIKMEAIVPIHSREIKPQEQNLGSGVFGYAEPDEMIDAEEMYSTTIGGLPAEDIDLVEEHTCNYSGAMKYDSETGGYKPTCSICGEPNDE